MRSILLVNPEFKVPGWEVKALPFLHKQALMVPIHLATIAALTPDDVEVEIWDEEVHGRIDDDTVLKKKYDLIGITTHSLIFERTNEIARTFRRHHMPVAMGGPGVMYAPEKLRDAADIIFYGEAELTWPRFISNWKAGNHRRHYREVTFPDLTLSPPPRWESIHDVMHQYLSGAVQMSRGCQFDCEFCEIPYLYGRQLRCKPIDRVLEEVAALQHLGLRHICFCEANFIGNPRYTKDLLRELIPLNNSFDTPLFFRTDLSLNAARDEELLQLLADANFNMVLIGIETPNKESLQETNKVLNMNRDVVADCKKIMSYGIQIIASMVIGFDHDTPEIFEQQFAFLQETHMPNIRLNLLRALHGSRLWRRLCTEERVLDVERIFQDELLSKDNRGALNIIPCTMTRAELLSGYLELVQKVYDWNNFAERVKGFISNVQREPSIAKKGEPTEFAHDEMYSFFFSLDEKARNAILDIFAYTQHHAPSMMPRVFGIIIRQYLFASNMQALRAALMQQIAFEESTDMQRFIEKEGDLVPEAFRASYADLFPRIYERVYHGLTDTSRTHEVIIEALADFLTPPEGMTGMAAEELQTVLGHLIDGAVEDENRLTGAARPGFMSGGPLLPDSQQNGLSEEILNAVEREVRAARASRWRAQQQR